jgi:hypothetical protein
MHSLFSLLIFCALSLAAISMRSPSPKETQEETGTYELQEEEVQLIEEEEVEPGDELNQINERDLQLEEAEDNSEYPEEKQ